MRRACDRCTGTVPSLRFARKRRWKRNGPRAPPSAARWWGFAAARIVILIAAPYLASSTAAIGDLLGFSGGLAGLLLLAITTSLPEAVVTTTSVRAGSYDLAVGNLFGSNCFNLTALLLLDIADGPGSLLARVEPGLAVSALAGLLLTGLAMLGVLDREERAPRRLERRPLVMLALYVSALVVTYRLGR